MQTAIITGSLGLVGSHVAQSLSKSGFRIVGIDCDVRASLFSDVQPLSTEDISRLNEESCIDKHYNVDIRDLHKLSDVISHEQSAHGIQIVVHCAAQPSHDWAASSPLTDLNINLLGTVNILESLRLVDYKGLFVFLSTNKVYGDLLTTYHSSKQIRVLSFRLSISTSRV